MKKTFHGLSKEEQRELLCNIANNLSNAKTTPYRKFSTRSVSKFSSSRGEISFELKEQAAFALFEYPKKYKGKIKVRQPKKGNETVIEIKMRRRWSPLDYILAIGLGVLLSLLLIIMEIPKHLWRLFNRVANSALIKDLMELVFGDKEKLGLNWIEKLFNSSFLKTIIDSSLFKVLIGSSLVLIILFSIVFFLILGIEIELIHKAKVGEKVGILLTEVTEGFEKEKEEEKVIEADESQENATP